MDSLEISKQYKEEVKKKKLSDKVQVKIEKARVRQVNTVAKSKIKSVKPSNVVNIPKKKLKTKTRSQLVKELDTIFSRFIRLKNIDYN